MMLIRHSIKYKRAWERSPVPYGVVLDRHHSRRQQLELLLNLEAVAPAGHLDAPVEHCRVRLPLQRPAPCTLNLILGPIPT
jgi:hypothetical protein